MPPTLVRPQTFTVLQQPDSTSPEVRLESSTLTSWFKNFTCSNTPEQNPRSLVFEVLIVDLVFVYKNIVQQFKILVFNDFDKSNSGCYTSSFFPECLSPGETPGVYTARLIGKTESLQQEER